MPTAPQHVSDLALERYALGEGTDAQRQALAAKLQVDAPLAARFAALQQSNEAILAAHPSAAMARKIRARAAVRQPSSAIWRPQALLKPLALTLAAAGLVFGLVRLQPSLPWESTERSKGDVNVLSLVLEAGNVAASALPGQVISLAWHPPAGQFGMMLALDAQQQVTILYPPNGTGESPALPHGSDMVRVRYQLDATPGFERIIALWAPRPFNMSAAMEAARQAADPQTAKLQPPEGVVWHQVDKVLLKR